MDEADAAGGGAGGGGGERTGGVVGGRGAGAGDQRGGRVGGLFAGRGRDHGAHRAAQNTIINYQRLDVPAGDTLQFLQPNSASRVLNRVNSPDPSHIDGTLRSNGIVYLVNPSGVMFGQGAVVDAAQFFAAASHISDQNFLSGVNLFANSTGTVQNLGTIRAGQVHLVGGQVGNGGLIISDGSAGIVTMSAGKDVYIGEVNSPVGTPHVTVKISGSPAAGSGPAVANTGGIHVAGWAGSAGRGGCLRHGDHEQRGDPGRIDHAAGRPGNRAGRRDAGCFLGDGERGIGEGARRKGGGDGDD